MSPPIPPGVPPGEHMDKLAISAVIAYARSCAATFVDEFPGQILDPATTEWDAAAWEMAPRELQEVDGAWGLYDATLVAEVARLACQD